MADSTSGSVSTELSVAISSSVSLSNASPSLLSPPNNVRVTKSARAAFPSA